MAIIESGFFDVILTAFNYSLLWQEAAIEVIPAAKKQNMGILLGSALQQGALAKRYDEEVRAKMCIRDRATAAAAPAVIPQPHHGKPAGSSGGSSSPGSMPP